MSSRCRYILVAILALIAVAPRVTAQAAVAPYKFDFGAGLGMSGYIGDANAGFPFAHPGFTADVRAGYIIDTRWALRAMLSTQGLSGNTADMKNTLPAGEEHREFTSQVWALGVRGEFNFFSFGIGETYKRLKRWSPYLAMGVGVGLSTSGGDTAVSPTIPMSFGVRFKATERVNLMAEFTMVKTFTDHFDGQIADLNHIKTDFYKNTDWYSRFTIGVTYEFGKRCETCHYVD